MRTVARFCHYLLTVWLCMLVGGMADSAEIRDTANASPESETQPAPGKRWYTNFDEAKRAATESGRAIMVVFR